MNARFLLCALVLSGLVPALGAVTINVSNESQLRSAITTVNASGDAVDTIVLAPGTYDRGAAGAQYLITKSVAGSRVIIRGGPGAAATTIIECNNASRGFHVQTAVTLTVEFRDLTIRQGRTYDDGATLAEARGGAILNRRSGTSATNSSIECYSVRFELCRAIGEDGTGGGTTAQANAYDGRGGAIYSRGGTVRLEGCIFNTCSVWGGDGEDPDYNRNGGKGGDAYGGAVYIHQGTFNAINTTFTGCSATGGDGGIGGDGDSASDRAQGGNGGDRAAASAARSHRRRHGHHHGLHLQHQRRLQRRVWRRRRRPRRQGQRQPRRRLRPGLRRRAVPGVRHRDHERLHTGRQRGDFVLRWGRFGRRLG
ncbi:MAG: hypothetical protein HS108_01480 [Planctomycetes bacterium]|nr:hypothetical protein [Planctomycetota bacterium]